ncbi:hypothetical protein, partial [Lysinibacillus sp. GbtcB16]|uniref:hypothetical protein n=1 Tax=Lysinibacillus sp. GbtcB16 TaxID=2824761 RepID=UPI001C30259F
IIFKEVDGFQNFEGGYSDSIDGYKLLLMDKTTTRASEVRRGRHVRSIVHLVLRSDPIRSAAHPMIKDLMIKSNHI